MQTTIQTIYEGVFMRKPALFLTVILLIICSATVQARIIHVPDDSTTIQGGINGAVDGDVVMVHTGVYYEHDIDFFGKVITVTGTDPEDSAVVAATIVDANSEGRVFLFQWPQDTTGILSGLTIREGYVYGDGGGVYCLGSNPTISMNIFAYNSAVGGGRSGGAIYCHGSDPLISDNIFISNSAETGGAIAIKSSSNPTITNNRFITNLADDDGGAIYSGERVYPCNPIITGNSFISNSANQNNGGAIACHNSPLIENNIFVANSSSGGTLWGGGAIWHSGSYSGFATILNNTFTLNSASENGGAIYCHSDARPIIRDSIFWGNIAPNGPEIYAEEPSFLEVTYCNVQGGWIGEGNIDVDPLFVTGPQGNYYLSQIDAGQLQQSPSVNAGDPVSPMIQGTTRTDEAIDNWPIDMGFHYSSDSDEPYIYLYVYPTGPITVLRGEVLDFRTYIKSNVDRTVSGDVWLSVLLPNSNEVFIPEGLLNYSNPLSGQILPFDFIDLDNWLFIPTQADTGSYSLIGRIGVYPDNVIDEESFGFRVVE
jgi:predicted outer membrane repeat protein